MVLSIEQRAFIVKYYYIIYGALNYLQNQKVSNSEVITKCKSEYERQFKINAPTDMTIINIIEKFESNYTLENRI